MAENYLYVQTVARRMKCSDKTVYRLIRSGKLSAVRIGGRALRIPESEFKSFMAGNSVESEDDESIRFDQ